MYFTLEIGIETGLENTCTKGFTPHIAVVLCSTDESFEDRAIWKLTNNGVFSAASAYGMMCCNKWDQPEVKWKTVWEWKGPERIKVFQWLVQHNALLTNTQRAKRKMVSS